MTHAVRYFFLRRLPTCQQMVPVMSQSLERRLTLRERVTLKLHLWVCLWCVWYLEQLHTMRAALNKRGEQIVEEETSPVKLSDEARERIRRRLAG